MKKLVFAVGIIVSLVAVAEQQAVTNAVTDAQKKAQRAEVRKRMFAKTGGLIECKAKGKVAIVNCQSRISKEVVAAKVTDIRKVLRIQIDELEAEPFSAKNAFERCRALPKGAAAALYIVDSPDMPMSLTSIEEHWAVINVTDLNDRRFARQFTRGLTLAFGGVHSQFKASPMQPVSKPEDLDKLVSDGVAFDSLNGIVQSLRALGVTQAFPSTYRKAVMEGWAPAPTNDVQKAIWEEVHAKPTKPMKIIFDPKKGE